MKRLGEGRGAHRQHLSGWASEGKRKRREVRSASQTSTRNSSSFLGPASNPFDCPTAPSPMLQITSLYFALKPHGPSIKCSDRGQALLTTGPLHWLLLLPRPFSPFTPLFCLSDHTSSFRFVHRSQGELTCPWRSHSSATAPSALPLNSHQISNTIIICFSISLSCLMVSSPHRAGTLAVISLCVPAPSHSWGSINIY